MQNCALGALQKHQVSDYLTAMEQSVHAVYAIFQSSSDSLNSWSEQSVEKIRKKTSMKNIPFLASYLALHSQIGLISAGYWLLERRITVVQGLKDLFNFHGFFCRLWRKREGVFVKFPSLDHKKAFDD